MKRFLIPILALAVLVGLVKATLAAADQIYVFNQLYTGRSHKEASTTWVNLDDFLKAARVPATELRHTPATHGQTSVSYNGKRFNVPVEARATDGVYVDGQRLVEGMGGRWSFNPSLGLTDVFVPSPNASHPTVAATGDSAAAVPPAASPSASSSAKPAETPASKDKSPLRISKFEFQDPTQPNKFNNVLITGTVEVKNTAPSEDYVDNVVITVHIQDGYENDLATVVHEVGKMQGGKSVSWDWNWSNASALLVRPVVEVSHLVYLTKAERDKLEKDKQPAPDKKISIRSGPTSGLPAATASVGGTTGGLTDTPTASVTSYNPPATPTETTVPPGFNPGATSTATDTSTPPPSAPPGY